MSGVTIAGTGIYTPSKVVTNDDMSKLVETSDEWITQRTGIRERRFSQGEPNYYMGREAALRAVEQAGVSPLEIDVIIGCTVTPDYYFPSLACIIQSEIGADNAFCWDMNAACSGFIYALDAARNYLAVGGAKTVLIVCSEVMSKVMDFTDRSTCVLFGDGAGAVVVKSGDGLFESFLKSEGKLGGAIVSSALGNRGPFADRANDPEYQKFPPAESGYLKMAGNDVYRFAVRALPETLSGACAKAGIEVSALDWLIPHQANSRIISTAAEKLGIDPEKIYVNVDRFGNTSSASIPLCLDELNRSGKLHRGDKIGLVGFGAGLTCGAIVMEW